MDWAFCYNIILDNIQIKVKPFPLKP